MPRPALTEEQRRETRKTIREAAAKLYAQTGLTDISARKIAERAGVSVGTLYSYFDNLTELMQSLWKEPVARFINDAEQALEEIDEPEKKMRTLLNLYAQFATENSATYRGAFLYVRPQSHDKPEQVDLIDDRFFCLFRDTIITGQQQGVVRKGDPDTLAQTVWAALHGAIALPQNLDRLALQPPEDALQSMIAAMLDWLTN